MPSIRRRESGKWQAVVRLVGLRPITRTFNQKSDAIAWGRHVEARLLQGDLSSGLDLLHRTSLASLIERYRDTVTINKKSAFSETVLINALLRQPFTGLSLSALTPRHFADYRDMRAQTVKASTINHDLTILSHVYKMAKAEWAIPVTNPLDGLRRPKADRPRDRRLMTEELDRIRNAANQCRNRFIRPTIEFALETAMRRGEILAITWDHVDTNKRVVHIPTTKTGRPRTVPLTPSAVAILESEPVSASCRPFPLTAESFHMAWKRIIHRSHIEDLHFHDLRHEAISRFFEQGLSIPEVALISGHRDPKMLFRYTHLRAEDVALKLR